LGGRWRIPLPSDEEGLGRLFGEEGERNFLVADGHGDFVGPRGADANFLVKPDFLALGREPGDRGFYEIDILVGITDENNI
jgi:hypothetical protein